MAATLTDDTFKFKFVNENILISIKNSLKFVPNGSINNIPALVRIMAWYRSGDKSLSEPMMVSLPTHICVTRPQWDNSMAYVGNYSGGCATQWPKVQKLKWQFLKNRSIHIISDVVVVVHPFLLIIIPTTPITTRRTTTVKKNIYSQWVPCWESNVY